MTKPARLITIPFSHYCEKARWAADYTGLDYVEDPYLPLVHMLATRPAGGTTVPLLVTRHGALTDSAKIVSHCDAHAAIERRIYPREAGAQREVDALEAVFNGELARATRLYGYFCGLPNARALAALVAPGLTAMQKRLFPLVTPIAGPIIKRRYRITPESAERAKETTRRIFGEMSARLAGKRYLVGDAFGAADLAFASLTAPVIFPEGHPAWASDVDRLPEALRALVLELRQTRAGEHVMRMYREHRRFSA